MSAIIESDLFEVCTIVGIDVIYNICSYISLSAYLHNGEIGVQLL